jgi:hypothetical protein
MVRVGTYAAAVDDGLATRALKGLEQRSLTVPAAVQVHPEERIDVTCVRYSGE